jgi:predicted Zn-dependent protease
MTNQKVFCGHKRHFGNKFPKTLQQAMINSSKIRLAQLNALPKPKVAKKRARRRAQIDSLKRKIAQAQALINVYQAIDENDRDAVFDFLNKWEKKQMPTSVVTKFKSNDGMESVINKALLANQEKIDEAFIDEHSNPKAIGTMTLISYTIYEAGAGEGYKLDENMQVVPIDTPLQQLILHLVVSGLFEYMVETAYLMP